MTRFTKAHACGNDFLIVERHALLREENERALAVELCARHTGLGADGVEYLAWTGEHAGTIRLYNADGSIAEISGNGTRCVAAAMAHSKGMRAGDTVTLATDAGIRECRLMEVRDVGSYEIATRMGVPVVEIGTVALQPPEHGPHAVREHAASLLAGSLVAGIVVGGAVVSTGNPHFVIFVEDESFRAQGFEWQELGRAICFHSQFPQQTNVEFVHVRSRDEIAIRIFERGVGPTSSSGTGTCACSAAAIALHGCAPRLLVEAPGGAQRTEWHAPEQEMLLTGPASIVAQGEAFSGRLGRALA